MVGRNKWNLKNLTQMYNLQKIFILKLYSSKLGDKTGS